jgi:hypothetical protein
MSVTRNGIAAIAMLTAVVAAPTHSLAVDKQVNPVSSYAVTLMNAEKPNGKVFGWIRLKDNLADAGYIYLVDEPTTPFLGSSRYIVTSVPLEMLPTLMYLLDNSSKIQIRYYDPQSVDVPPNAFLETMSKTGAVVSFSVSADSDARAPFGLDEEQNRFISELLRR